LPDEAKDDDDEPLLWETVEHVRATEGPGHPRVIAALERLGTIYKSRDDADRLGEIRRRFQEAQKAGMRFRRAFSRYVEASNLHAASDHDRAAVVAMEALELWEQDPPLTPDRKGIENYLGLLGSIELSRGRFDEAEALLVRALSIEGDDPTHDALARGASGVRRFRLGEVYRLQGRAELARQTLKRALPTLSGQLASDCRAELARLRTDGA
jgi:tetratricopeptide (TPR) repeat protein